MRTLFVIGTASSGKSTLTSALVDWLRENEQTVATVNLDPAAITLPYEPDVDIREMVDYERIMAVRGVGPNSALIYSVREVARNVDVLVEEIKDLNVDYLIVDTPGQMEIFAFRKEGVVITRALTTERGAILYLLDPILSYTPRTFASSMFLAASVYLRFVMPMIIIVTKTDVVPRKYLLRISRWLSSQEAYEIDLDRRGGGVTLLMAKEVAKAVSEIRAFVPHVLVSSKAMEGLSALHMAITRTFGEGEDELR
ncbi:MAG: ATP/GTP-binding protein [Thaumarchaeota archaeon]|nr:ATP/GTP-binding protein [Candidatus Calditenuaceae archaeon]MDW8187282.1 ATP/GTP-binding protein [Nitrososphaerota archaeon]